MLVSEKFSRGAERGLMMGQRLCFLLATSVFLRP